MSSALSIRSLISTYLSLKGIRTKPNQIDTCLLSSPVYPSILSISHTLSYFGIRNKVFHSDIVALKKCGKVAIAHLNIDEGRFILVYCIENEKIFYYDPYLFSKVEMSQDDFNKKWSGVVLIPSEEMPFQKNIFKLRLFNKPPILFILLFLSIIFIFPSVTLFFFDSSSSIYLCIQFVISNILGVYISILLLLHSLNLAQSYIKPICTVNQYFSCDSVLNSKYAKLFSTISFTDIGFIYFLSGLITILFSELLTKQLLAIELLALLSFCSLPFVCFSIICQKYFVKKWCPLCLCSIVVIVYECIISIQIIPNVNWMNYLNKTLTLYFFSAFISLICLLLFKKILLLFAELKNINTQFLNFKRNKFSFSSHFNRIKQVEFSRNIGIMIGDKSSPIILTTIVNPLCNPCKIKLKEIIALIDKYPHIIQWNIRFDGVSEIENKLNNPQLHLMEVCSSQKVETNTFFIIKDWISSNSFKDFTNKHPLKDGIKQNTKRQLQEQIEENESVGVNSVPFICLNNILLPKEYRIQDLAYLIQDADFLRNMTDYSIITT